MNIESRNVPTGRGVEVGELGNVANEGLISEVRV